MRDASISSAVIADVSGARGLILYIVRSKSLIFGEPLSSRSFPFSDHSSRLVGHLHSWLWSQRSSGLRLPLAKIGSVDGIITLLSDGVDDSAAVTRGIRTMHAHKVAIAESPSSPVYPRVYGVYTYPYSYVKYDMPESIESH